MDDFLTDSCRKAIKWARETLEMRQCVILNLETTGLGSDAEIVQIGVLALDGEVLLDTLVKPENPIPAEATRIHGISDADVANAPAFSEVAEQLFGVRDFEVIIAYNAAYDERILRQVCARHSIEMPAKTWNYAMEKYAQFYGDWNDYHESFRWQKLTEACRQQEITVKDAHTAIGGCRAILVLIQVMADEGAE